MAEKILVVEDVDHNRTLINAILSASNYIIVENEDGNNVLDMTLEEKPSLILMDIQLPKKSGIELIQELKAHEDTKHIPIIAVTAFAMDNDKARILKSGCEDYLSKPFKAAELTSKVQELITKSKT